MFEGAVVFAQCAGDAEDDRAGLAGGAAAGAVDEDVEFTAGVGDFEGAEDGFAIALFGEVIVELALIDENLAVAGRNADAGDGALSAAGAPGVILLLRRGAVVVAVSLMIESFGW